MRHIATRICLATVLLAPGCPLVGQCTQQWLAGDAIPFTYGNGNATTLWDPDGTGPASAVLVVGGRFGVGTLLDTSLAAFDGTGWSALGTPPFLEAHALVVWNGLLVAAGDNGSQDTIATWNGSSWSIVGSAGAEVNTMVVFQGDLYVGGRFHSVNGVPANGIARWNGTAWSQPGQGVNGEVMAMAVFGSLHVGGAFSLAGSLAVGNLAVWSGTTWSAAAACDAPVRSLAARIGATATASFLFAGGDFTMVGPVPAQHVARFNSLTGAWTAIPGLPGTSCLALHVRSTGATTFQLHAAVGGVVPDKVWRLNGTTWSSLGETYFPGQPQPTSLAFFDNQCVVTLEIAPVSGTGFPQSVRTHDGTSWQPLCGPGFDAGIRAVTAVGNDLVVAGDFLHYGGTALARIARGSPGAWQPLGSGLDGGDAFAVCALPNGDVIVGGDFATAGGLAVNRIARWNGTTWAPLGTGVDAVVHALLALPDGQLIAGGSFTTAGGVAANRVARWNGTSWSPLGSGTNSAVYALARTSNGDIFAAGSFTTAGGQAASRIARWNGSTWSPLGAGLGATASALTVLPDDHVVAGGAFQTAGGVFSPSVARWNGTTWLAQSIPATAWDTAVQALVALPNGEYFAAGFPSTFALGAPGAAVARHVGGAGSQQWATFDLQESLVLAAAPMPNGDVAFGGFFLATGGVANHNLAVLRPTCPAAAVPYGGGCAGTGGANVLTATALPWAGGTLRARASGMPANGIALAVTGFAPLALPMAAVLPQGVAGCTLLASPDLLDALLPIAGVVDTQVALPNTPTLAGQVLHHQVVPLAFDLAGNLVAVTGTNGLALTIGVL